MRKFFSSVVVVVSLLAVMGCSNGIVNDLIPSKAIEINDSKVKSAMDKIGTVTKVYTAAQDSNKTARYYTGETVRIGGGSRQAKFEAYLVEYDDFTKNVKNDVSNYIERVSQSNDEGAWLHQGYAGINFDRNKRYIEFAIYRDLDNNNPIMYETRTLKGNFLDEEFIDDNGKRKWYASQIWFDTEMTADILRMKVVNGEDKIIECKDDNDSVTAFGKPKKIYRNKANIHDAKIKIADIYLVEYESMYDYPKNTFSNCAYWRDSFLQQYVIDGVNLDLSKGWFVEFRKDPDYFGETPYWQIRYKDEKIDANNTHAFYFEQGNSGVSLNANIEKGKRYSDTKKYESSSIENFFKENSVVPRQLQTYGNITAIYENEYNSNTSVKNSQISNEYNKKEFLIEYDKDSFNKNIENYIKKQNREEIGFSCFYKINEVENNIYDNNKVYLEYVLRKTYNYEHTLEDFPSFYLKIEDKYYSSMAYDNQLNEIEKLLNLQ